MQPRIDMLTIERFRALRHLKMEGLGRVNLLTGRNNTGKSSVLEALRLLASQASPAVIHSILRYREEDLGEAEEPTGPLEAEGLLQILSLFHGFPQLSEKPESMVISAHGPPGPLKVVLGVSWVSEDGEPGLLGGNGDGIPALMVEAGGTQQILTPDHFRRYALRRPLRPDFGKEPALPCIFVSPYGNEHTAPLGPLWDKVALSDREQDVIEALQIIGPEISAVSMVGGESPRQQRTAIVRAGNLPRPVPLRSFGDGLNRLFGIALSLVNAKEGFLLIDEFENGMHHTVQLETWRVVFKLARRLDIQVFATSHSWDAVETFQKAAAETPEKGVLIRLSHKGEKILPTLFAEDDLAVATRERIEVR